MDFNLLFALVGSLNFTVNFDVYDGEAQDYFIFEGLNSSAHLYRQNYTVYLYVRDFNNYETYQTDVIDRVEFSWIGFKINNTKMEERLNKAFSNVEFNSFTFISPIINATQMNIHEEGFTNLDPSFYSDVNYGYIVAIALTVAIIVECKAFIVRLVSANSSGDESDYVTMENI